MSDIVPRLDTIEFDQLVEQARGDIPRYAPDWTDHNLHDPGITFIDLLAWIVDQQVYRTGSVGGRHRRAFAALLGQRSDGPEPARGLIWPNRPVADERFVEAGSEVICAEHADLPFALEWPDDAVGDVGGHRSIYFPAAVLTSIGCTVDGVERPAPSLTGDGSWVLGERGLLAETVLSLRFAGQLGSPASEASVALGIEVAPPPGPPLTRGDRPWGPVIFSYRVGAGRWVDLDVLCDGTCGLATTGAVILKIPTAPQTPAETGGSELRLSFDRGFFPVSPPIRYVSINVVPVVQRERVKSAPVGEGTGQPDQSVEIITTDLVRSPSRPKGPVLEVEVGGEHWEQRPDFAQSGPEDPHFVVQPGYLLFGNGVNGQRPALGAQITHSELARTSGAVGNVRHGLSWSVPALNADAPAYGVNRRPLMGGTDGTGAEDLAIAAREAATRRSAMLTDHELVAAAYGLAGMAVGRAEVLAGFDHRLNDRRVDGVRTLVVIPHQIPSTASDGSNDRALVSQAYLDEVAARLGPRRVLGERLIVQGPNIVLVDLSLVVTTEAGTVSDDVKTAVQRAIRSRLSVLAGSDPVEPWPLGRDLDTTEVASIAANVSGVRTVLVVRVATIGEPPGDGPITVPPDGLVLANQVEITVEAAPSGHQDHQSLLSGSRGSTR